MGMRVVALVEEFLEINNELRVIQKLGTVSGKILDKILILDRKHRIKDRIAGGITYVYNQVSRAANPGSDSAEGGGPREGDRRDRRTRRDDDSADQRNRDPLPETEKASRRREDGRRFGIRRDDQSVGRRNRDPLSGPEKVGRRRDGDGRDFGTQRVNARDNWSSRDHFPNDEKAGRSREDDRSDAGSRGDVPLPDNRKSGSEDGIGQQRPDGAEEKFDL